MITYEATFSVLVTVNEEEKLAQVQEALYAAARSIGTDVDVNEDDVSEVDDAD